MKSCRISPTASETTQILLTTAPCPFGDSVLAWVEEPRTTILKVFLPGEREAKQLAWACYPDSLLVEGNSLPLPLMQARAFIIALFKGTQTEPFPLSMLDLERLSPFQQTVLRTEAQVRRGEICTYQQLAQAAGHPKGSRIAGQALARNPFPLLIPCHRAIGSDGSLTGYQGGLAMKRYLLEREQVPFLDDGRVDLARVKRAVFT